MSGLNGSVQLWGIFSETIRLLQTQINAVRCIIKSNENILQIIHIYFVLKENIYLYICIQGNVFNELAWKIEKHGVFFPSFKNHGVCA